jgi:hypothetical protein
MILFKIIIKVKFNERISERKHVSSYLSRKKSEKDALHDYHLLPFKSDKLMTMKNC